MSYHYPPQIRFVELVKCYMHIHDHHDLRVLNEAMDLRIELLLSVLDDLPAAAVEFVRAIALDETPAWLPENWRTHGLDNDNAAVPTER